MTDDHSPADSPSVSTAEDPTEAILSKSALDSKRLCDYVINVATGCRHGCRFCYVPATPNIRARSDLLEDAVDVEDGQREWGQYVLYRDDLPERLDAHLSRKRTWRETEGGQGIVGISFATDCYMDGRAGAITRGVVEALADHERYARVLTRNPILALQDLDVFQDAGEYVTIGSSIPCLDAEQVAAIEPRAPAPAHRLEGLAEFAAHGVQTFVSMSPTYPTQDRDDLRQTLERIAECDPAVVFHEPINPRGANFEMTVEAAQDAGLDSFATALDALHDGDRWLAYSLRHFRAVQEIGADLGLPVHLWPDSRHLSLTSGAVNNWLQEWTERQSPEPFAGRPTPNDDPPALPPTIG